MDELSKLTTKQESFCIHYTAIGSETFGNGTKSAIAAKYSEKSAYSQASALLKNPKIQERIKELHSENMNRNNLTVDKVLADLEHDKIMARQAKQFSVAKECSVAQGKYLAMFTDKNITQEIPTYEFTPEEEEIYRDIARQLTARLSRLGERKQNEKKKEETVFLQHPHPRRRGEAS